MRFLLLLYIGFFLIQRVSSQTTDKSIKDINTYVSKVDSLCSIQTFLTTDQNVNAPIILTISEGVIENKERRLKGGFSNETVTSPNLDTIYLIKHSDNLEKYLIESYYFKNNKIIFSKIELQDGGNERKTLFLRKDYYTDDKILSSTYDQNKLKNKFKWRTNFDPLTNGYFYYKKFKENGNTK